MERSFSLENIDTTTFDELLQEYPNVVPDKLHSLDQQRYDLVPSALKERKDNPHLTKSEAATLVDWKLSHGKFRPALKGLFQQNAEQAVHDVTRDGFSTFSRSGESAEASLNTLTKLRGIGPATASLLLSVYDPQAAPFFSDELFRWCMYEEGKGNGWDREIKYNLKEYLQLFEKVQQLQRRLSKESPRDVDAVDIEKVAYALGKRGASRVGTSEVPSRGTKRKGQTSNGGLPMAKETPSSKILKTKDAKSSSKEASESTSVLRRSKSATR